MMAGVPTDVAGARRFGRTRAERVFRDLLYQTRNPLTYDVTDWFKGAEVRMPRYLERFAIDAANQRFLELKTEYAATVRTLRRRSILQSAVIHAVWLLVGFGIGFSLSLGLR